MIDPFATAHLVFLELALFAAVGFLLGGVDELLVDLLWFVRTAWRRSTIYVRNRRAYASDMMPSVPVRRYAVLVPAWQEAEVIGAMLTANRKSYSGSDMCFYVGVYPNDPATMAAVAPFVGDRVRMIPTDAEGPTTKADCLNSLWRALLRERSQSHAWDAIILHDAEDLVSAHETRLFDRLLDRFGVIQLPVVPVAVAGSRWISGHYCDEFAESHGKTLVVREAIGAGIPLAGVGCAIRMDILEDLSDRTGGKPFSTASLTEDYEAGIRLAADGVRTAFVRIQTGPGGPLVATRAHFPATLDEATRQKARWIVGIAIAGWDRLGWGRGLAENWMRLRDRRGLIAAVILLSGYLAALLWALLALAAWSGNFVPPPLSNGLTMLLQANAALLLWRLAMRAYFVQRIYGTAEALISVPRAIVGNVIAIIAARRAVFRYIAMAKAGRIEWDKTRHSFPETGQS